MPQAAQQPPLAPEAVLPPDEGDPRRCEPVAPLADGEGTHTGEALYIIITGMGVRIGHTEPRLIISFQPLPDLCRQPVVPARPAVQGQIDRPDRRDPVRDHPAQEARDQHYEIIFGGMIDIILGVEQFQDGMAVQRIEAVQEERGLEGTKFLCFKPQGFAASLRIRTAQPVGKPLAIVRIVHLSGLLLHEQRRVEGLARRQISVELPAARRAPQVGQVAHPGDMPVDRLQPLFVKGAMMNNIR